MAMCANEVGQKIRRLREKEVQVSTAVDFQDYSRPLETMTEFKCLGRVLTASIYNWLTVVFNLRKARIRWERLSRILGWEGADPGPPELFTRRSSRRTSSLDKRPGI